MVMAYASISGTITKPGSNVGIRARVTATPMTTANALKFPTEDRITWGPESAETNSAGVLASLKVPTNHGMPELYWRIEAEPLDRLPGLPKKWTVGTFAITASADLSDLVEIDTIVVDAQLLVNVSDLVADAEAAALVATNNANGFSIGTTTTGAAGSAAAATITGTAPNRLLNLTIPAGDTGPQGAQGIQGIQGVAGPAGRNVTSVTRTSGTGAPGTTDTYTIAFSDATSTTFDIYNGTDGATGATGRGIVSVVRTSGTGAPGTTDTYTITYSDASTSTFTVYNGANGTGTGDVVGPAAAVDSQVAVFDTASGKLLKDGGATVAQIRDRSTHTGTQAASTITGLAAVATSGSASDITTGTLPTSVLPPLAINETFTVADQAAMLALAAQRGDMAIRSDNGRTYVLASDSPSTLADWKEVLAAGQVQSVNSKTGVVSLTASDVGAATTAQGALADTAVQPGSLGDAAAKNTGTTAGTVAAGDDSRITGAAQKSANLSDLASTTTARANLDAASSSGGGREKSAALSATTGTATGDLSAASIFTVTPTGNITLAFSNVPASGTACTVTVIVSQGATAYTVTPPTGTKWMGAAAPTQAVNKACAFTFLTVNGGTTWYASAAVEQ